MLSFSFDDDIYSFTYLMYMKVDDDLLHSELMLKSIFAFSLQIGLAGLVFYDNIEEDYIMGSSDNMDVLNLTRFLCCVILHVILIPEFKKAL